MSSMQRVILIVGLLALAAIMAVSCCEWTWGESTTYGLLIGSWEDAGGWIGETRMARVRAWGIVANPTMSTEFAALFGLFIPAAIILTSAWLLSGLRAGRRREQGRCPRCGYDLKFKYEAGCPECGWRRR
jgi:hypothetical protein